MQAHPAFGLRPRASAVALAVRHCRAIKSLEDGASHDRLGTDPHSIRSFALLF